MKTDRFYRPELDALRLWACAQVFIFHAWYGLMERTGIRFGGEGTARTIHAVVSGKFGVDLFFCLSSFLIVSLLLRERDTRGSVDVRRFWIRRILRIWPLYFTFLALCAFVFPNLGLSTPLSPEAAVLYATFAGNFHSIAMGHMDGPESLLWTVCVEEQFYLVLPILFAVLGSRRLVLAGVVALAVATTARAVLLAGNVDGGARPLLWVHTLSRLDPFVTGGLLALWVWKRGWEPKLSTRALLGAVGVGGPAALAFLVGWVNESGSALWAYPFISVSQACLVAAVYGMRIRIPGAVVYLGRISYGIYVFHMIVITAVAKMFPFPVAPAEASLTARLWAVTASLGLSALVTISIAALSYRFLESPFLKIKERFAAVPSAPVVGLNS